MLLDSTPLLAAGARAGVPAAAKTAAGAPIPAADSPALAAVKALLTVQAAAWNRGDLVAFTAVYADDATFVAPNGIRHGRAEVLARYRQRYPTPRAMGHLTLVVLEGRPLGAEGTCGPAPLVIPAKPAKSAPSGVAGSPGLGSAAATCGPEPASALKETCAMSVVAHWRLAYPTEPGKKTAEGSTLLVLRRLAGRWQILQDASM
jgi:ketosteroid isomerase-like protein